MAPSPTNRTQSRSPILASAFARVHKGALGVAVGVALGASLAIITLFHVVVRPVNALDLGLLAQYFYGYTVSWRGIGVGFLWGFAAGGVAGWFVGLVRNFTLSAWLLVIRTKANLAQPFLDDIG
jgi:hypothetical protein